MRTLVYLHNRPRSDALHMGVDDKFIFTDAPGTHRESLMALVDGKGIHPGDVVRVCALSDLGHGAASKTMQARIEALGATIEVMPPQKIADGGRLSKKHPKRADMCAIWWSSLDQADALDKIGKIAGQKVNRNQVNRLCKYSRNPNDRTLD